MKLRAWTTAVALGLATIAGCSEETNTDAPASTGSDITGTAPATTGSPKAEEAGGSGAGGAFTANPTGTTKPSEVPANYPRPEGQTPAGAEEKKPAEATPTGGENKTAEITPPAEEKKPADAAAGETSKPAESEKL